MPVEVIMAGVCNLQVLFQGEEGGTQYCFIFVSKHHRDVLEEAFAEAGDGIL